MPIIEEWVTDRELAAWLKVSRTKLYQDRAKGEGPPYSRVGRSVRYNVPAVREWLAKHSVGLS